MLNITLHKPPIVNPKFFCGQENSHSSYCGRQMSNESKTRVEVLLLFMIYDWGLMSQNYYIFIYNAAEKTCKEQWMTVMDSERESGNSDLSTCFVDYIYIHIIIKTLTVWLMISTHNNPLIAINTCVWNFIVRKDSTKL